MIDQLKLLQTEEMLTVDNDQVRELVGTEDLTVENAISCELEDGELLVLSLSGYTLIVTNFDDTERFFFYESFEEGRGKSKYYRKDDFVRSFKMAQEEGAIKYSIEEGSPLISDDDEIRICQYKGDHYYSSVAVSLTDTCWSLLRGFEVSESEIVL